MHVHMQDFRAGSHRRDPDGNGVVLGSWHVTQGDKESARGSDRRRREALASAQSLREALSIIIASRQANKNNPSLNAKERTRQKIASLKIEQRRSVVTSLEMCVRQEFRGQPLFLGETRCTTWDCRVKPNMHMRGVGIFFNSILTSSLVGKRRKSSPVLAMSLSRLQTLSLHGVSSRPAFSFFTTRYLDLGDSHSAHDTDSLQ